MSANALKTLRDAIKQKQFDGAYYIYGEDEFQKNDAVEQLVDAVVDPATRDFNLSYVNGSEMDAESIESLAGTPPMMAERRVVVIRDITSLKKDARKRLDSILKKPSVDVSLILVGGAGAKADKALDKMTTPLKFPLLEPHRLPRWIAHQAKTIHNTEITSDAAELLISAVGNDLYLLGAELDKLASFTNGDLITEHSVSTVVGVNRGETVGDLLDCVLERDAEKALELLPHVLMQPKASVITIIMGLSTQMLAIAWGRARLEDGASPGRMEGEFFNLLKKTGAFPSRPWGSAARAWARAVPDWSAKACDIAIEALVTADDMIKESRVSSEEQVLSTTILAICAAEKRNQYRHAGVRRTRQAA